MRNRLAGPLADPAAEAGHPDDHPTRVGFFTDTSICIGCKACEVACKEWNQLPEDGLGLLGHSYDNTGALGASTWRHVAFVEQRVTPGGAPVDLGMPTVGPPSATGAATRAGQQAGNGSDDGPGALRWLMSSDVCKHCTHAACLDVCPTGAIFRSEFGTVVIQDDVCNGCGYCVPACPYGVVDIRESTGGAYKCTMCYDRLKVGLEPACAKACPTDSIQFGPLDELRARAARRVAELRAAGVDTARLYGESPADGVGGDGAFFLLLDEPEVYGLPPDPVVTTRDLPSMWWHAAVAAATVVAAATLSFLGRRR
jgi:formate dehydrogenase iron-sulfur subunit